MPYSGDSLRTSRFFKWLDESIRLENMYNCQFHGQLTYSYLKLKIMMIQKLDSDEYFPLTCISPTISNLKTIITVIGNTKPRFHNAFPRSLATVIHGQHGYSACASALHVTSPYVWVETKCIKGLSRMLCSPFEWVPGSRVRPHIWQRDRFQYISKVQN